MSNQCAASLKLIVKLNKMLKKKKKGKPRHTRKKMKQKAELLTLKKIKTE